jgi:polynucleotide 5'-hydroxyl-kinase GRC3/NOL9
MAQIPLDVPDAWRRSAMRILSEGWQRILVVGATDRGKSSYCKFLVNALLQEERKVSFVDGDIGQKDVGPPATVTLADFDAPMDFDQAVSGGMYFVGHMSPFPFSPPGCWHPANGGSCEGRVRGDRYRGAGSRQRSSSRWFSD